MRVLMHTPLKAPDHPLPSGDREMARGWFGSSNASTTRF